MNRVELHPEGLLDRARRRTATPEEMERLEAHLVTCKSCAFEHAMAADCDRASAPRPDDDVVLARVRDRTLRQLAVQSHKPRMRSVSRRSLTIATAGAVLLAAACAAGAMFVRHLRLHDSDSSNSARSIAVAKAVDQAQPSSPEPPKGGDESSSAVPEASSLSIETPATEHEPIPAEKTVRSPARSTRSSPERTSSTEPLTTPGELFARANAARRAGDVNEAAHLYRDLQRSFPGSVQELVSRVTLGRLLLDRLGDASGSLVLFDSYLANPSHHGLREEAMIGRALALGRLRRVIEERAAWTAFLAAYPTSAYSERARARLAGLR